MDGEADMVTSEVRNTWSDLPNVPERIILNISLFKPTNQKLGMTIVGGSERLLNGIFVKSISKNGVIHNSGLLQEGDQLLTVNNQPLIGLTHAQAVDQLIQCTCDVSFLISRMVESRPRRDSRVYALSPFHKRILSLSSESSDDEPDILEYKPIV